MVLEIPINWSTEVASTSSAVEDVCERVLSEVKAADFTQDDIFAVHLALEEVFLNAIKHGNCMDPAKQIKIEYSISSDKVEIAVTDEGEGFNPDDVPDPRYGENLYRFEGRGLFLINSYMNVVKFNKRGNTVEMIRYKGGSEPAANNNRKTK